MSALNKYHNDIANHKLLTREEEVILINEYRAGNETALETLIICNLRLVTKIANDFKGRGVAMEDLIQVGNLGLIRGVKKWQPDKGTKISSYCAFWIKQSMQQEIYKHGQTIKTPQKVHLERGAIRNLEKQIRQTENREPTIKEISQKLGKKESYCRNVLDRYTIQIASLDAPILSNSQGSGNWLDNLIEPDDNFLNAIDKADYLSRLKSAIAVLDDREQDIIKKRFGLDSCRMTLQECSDFWGCTRERIRQIQFEALGKLKQALEGEHITHLSYMYINDTIVNKIKELYISGWSYDGIGESINMTGQYVRNIVNQRQRTIKICQYNKIMSLEKI